MVVSEENEGVECRNHDSTTATFYFKEERENRVDSYCKQISFDNSQLLAKWRNITHTPNVSQIQSFLHLFKLSTVFSGRSEITFQQKCGRENDERRDSEFTFSINRLLPLTSSNSTFFAYFWIANLILFFISSTIATSQSSLSPAHKFISNIQQHDIYIDDNETNRVNFSEMKNFNFTRTKNQAGFSPATNFLMKGMPLKNFKDSQNADLSGLFPGKHKSPLIQQIGATYDVTPSYKQQYANLVHSFRRQRRKNNTSTYWRNNHERKSQEAVNPSDNSTYQSEFNKKYVIHSMQQFYTKNSSFNSANLTRTNDSPSTSSRVMSRVEKNVASLNSKTCQHNCKQPFNTLSLTTQDRHLRSTRSPKTSNSTLICDSSISVEQRMNMLLEMSPCIQHKTTCELFSYQDIINLSNEDICIDVVRNKWERAFTEIETNLLNFDTIFTPKMSDRPYTIKYNIEECKEKYALWVCSTKFPLYVTEQLLNDDSRVEMIHEIGACSSICTDVERSCPFFILHEEEDKAAGNPSFICGDKHVPNSDMSSFSGGGLGGGMYNHHHYFYHYHTLTSNSQIDGDNCCYKNIQNLINPWEDSRSSLPINPTSTTPACYKHINGMMKSMQDLDEANTLLRRSNLFQTTPSTCPKSDAFETLLVSDDDGKEREKETNTSTILNDEKNDDNTFLLFMRLQIWIQSLTQWLWD